jgi:hypothetical protein
LSAAIAGNRSQPRRKAWLEVALIRAAGPNDQLTTVDQAGHALPYNLATGWEEAAYASALSG